MSELPAPIYNFVANSYQFPYPTQFSRASIGGLFGCNGQYGYTPAGVPRFDHDPLTGVCKGLIVESAAIFQDAFSQQFDNAAWTKVRASVSPNAAISPDGLMTADKLVEDASIGNTHGMSSAYNFVSGTYYVVLAFVKACERTSLGIAFPSAPFGASVRYDFTLAGSGAAALITNGSGNSANIIPTGCGWYIVLVKAQATTTASGSINILLKNDSSASYDGDGVSGIYLWEAKMYAGSFPVSTLPTGWETASATSNNIGTGSKTFAVGNDSTVAGQSIPTGANVRVWQTSNPGNYLSGLVTSHSGTTLTVSITATGGSGTGITDWTIQAGASVTRAGDVITTDLRLLRDGSGAAAWIGTGGTLVVQGWTAAGKPTGAAVQVLAQIDDGTSSNRVRIYRSVAGNLKCSVDAAGVNQVDLDLGVVADSTECKVAFSFGEDSFYASFNGGTPVSNTSGTMPTGLVTRRHGCDSAGTQQWGGYIKLDQTYNQPLPAYVSVLSVL